MQLEDVGPCQWQERQSNVEWGSSSDVWASAHVTVHHVLFENVQYVKMSRNRRMDKENGHLNSGVLFSCYKKKNAWNEEEKISS